MGLPPALEDFEQFHLQWAPKVAMHVRRAGIPDPLIDDVSQEAFLRIWRHGPGFDPERSKLTTYLWRLIRYEVAEQRRAMARRWKYESAQYLSAPTVQGDDADTDDDPRFAFEEQAYSIIECNDALQATQNTLLQLPRRQAYAPRLFSAVVRRVGLGIEPRQIDLARELHIIPLQVKRQQAKLLELPVMADLKTQLQRISA